MRSPAIGSKAGRRRRCGSASRTSRTGWARSATEDPENWAGEAKIAGTATEIVDEEEVKRRNGEAGENGPSHLFRLDITEASTVGLDDA
jgi:hypothetical protein